MGHCGGSNDDTPEEAKERTQNQVRALAIPGVRCGKCLGRIDEHAIEAKRKLHERLLAGEPFVPPLLCTECWLAAVHELCKDAEDEPARQPLNRTPLTKDRIG